MSSGDLCQNDERQWLQVSGCLLRFRGESCEPEGHAAGSQNSGVKRQRTITWPESATRVCPVMVRALSEHRKTAASAMSCPLISRRSAVLFT